MNEKIKKIIVILILLIVAFLVCYQCDTNPIKNQKTVGIDSSVFIYIAKSMKNGMLPYKDIFDHKGPLLYFIDYIGLLLTSQSYVGIWLIEVACIYISLFFLYKTAKLFIKSDTLCILASLISISPLIKYLQNGNFTEEYALPFLCISLYYVMIYLVKNKNLKKIESFILGICMGCVLLLRPNMIPLYIVYGIIVLIDLLKRRKYKEIREIILYFLLGIAIILGSCIIILQVKGILADCFNEYIIFNFEYIKIPKVSIMETIKEFYEISKLVIASIVICVVSSIYKLKKDRKNVIIPISSLLYTLLTIIIIISPRRIFSHYAIILIPTLLVPIALVFKFMSERKKYFSLILIIGILIVLNRNNISQIRQIYTNPSIKKEQEQNREIARIIQEKSAKDEKIIVIGNNCSIYLEADRQSASKYVYQFPIINIDNKIKEQVKYDLECSSIKFIVYNTDRINELENIELKEIIQKLLKEEKYKKIDQINKYVIMERN